MSETHGDGRGRLMRYLSTEHAGALLADKDAVEDMKDYLARKTIVRESGCWEWQGSLKPKGYGVASVDGVSCRAHRLAYLLFKGEIGNGLVVMHSCDNRACCNPDHLSVGTHIDNVLDMREKGRNQKPSLSESEIVVVRRRLATGEASASIARGIGRSRSLVSYIKSGRRYSGVGSLDGFSGECQI